MSTNYATRAEEYYRLMGAKNIEGLKDFLAQNVEFYGPLAKLKGKEAVTQAVTHFANSFNSLTIKARFGEGEQAMVVYDVDIPGISKEFPGAALLTFQEGLIVRIQLFYDGTPFAELAKKIFAKS